MKLHFLEKLRSRHIKIIQNRVFLIRHLIMYYNLLLRKLAEILDQIHAAGYCYGDLNPNNIFVSKYLLSEVLLFNKTVINSNPSLEA